MNELPAHVDIREVSLRDGLQIEEPISLAAKLKLLEAIAATGAERVIVMHGYEDALCAWLREQGLRAERFGRGSAQAEHVSSERRETPAGTVAEPGT